MFSWYDFIYDNDWISFRPEGVSYPFYLCDAAIGISPDVSEYTARTPAFIDCLLLAIEKQKEIFSEEAIANRTYLTRYKFKFQPRDGEKYALFQVLETPFLEKGQHGAEHKLYREWYVKELIDAAKKEGEQDAAMRYTDTIASLKLQIARLNEIIQHNSTFERGKAQSVIEELLAKSRKEHEEQMAELRREKAELEKLRQYSDYGYVYLFHDAETGMYKIGKSKNPDNRLSQVRTSTANNIVCFCTIETHEMTTLEAELHQQFATQRIRGEWFSLTDADVQCIKERV